MPDFYFKIYRAATDAVRLGPVSFPDQESARDEAAAMLTDFARDIVADLEQSPTWQLDVLDEAGKAVFRIKVVAERL